MRAQVASRWSLDREQTWTVAPRLARIWAARCPTGLVPPRMTRRCRRRIEMPRRSPDGRRAAVFDPFESIITEMRIGPKNSFVTFLRRAPRFDLAPPMKIAVFFRSPGPRVNIAP